MGKKQKHVFFETICAFITSQTNRKRWRRVKRGRGLVFFIAGGFLVSCKVAGWVLRPFSCLWCWARARWRTCFETPDPSSCALFGFRRDTLRWIETVARTVCFYGKSSLFRLRRRPGSGSRGRGRACVERCKSRRFVFGFEFFFRRRKPKTQCLADREK